MEIPDPKANYEDRVNVENYKKQFNLKLVDHNNWQQLTSATFIQLSDPEIGLMLFTTALHSPGMADTTVSFGQITIGGVASSSNTLKLHTAESPARFFAISVMI